MLGSVSIVRHLTCASCNLLSFEETIPQVLPTDVDVPGTGDFTLLDPDTTSLLSTATTVEKQQAIISQLPDQVVVDPPIHGASISSYCTAA